MLKMREGLERDELEVLAPYALKSAHSRGRVFDEAPSATRTAFERDRDRIIHTTAFRRLEYKTQVFVFYEGDHYRTRLTHTLEVAQLGRSMARNLGANEVLTEAICLAHDLGHPPFGHGGEHALDLLMQEHGGFNHNTQSYRIVTDLEHRYPDFDGLNLTYEVREGIIKHETAYDRSDASEYEPEKRASLEAQLANLADEIAYNAHDLDDGLRAQLLTPAELEELAIWRELRRRIGWNGEPFDDIVRHALIRELIGMTVGDVVATTNENLRAANIESPEGVQCHSKNVVHYSDEMQAIIAPLKRFLYERMYRHYRLVRMQIKAERFVAQLFEAYLAEPDMLPGSTRRQLATRRPERVVCDYIAGMTDRFALDEWQRLFDPYTLA